MKTIEAANKRFNDFLDRESPRYAKPLGYGEFDRDDLELPNQLDDHADQVIDYSTYFVR